MATKSEENSRNGTLSINQQTTSQRVKFGQRFRGGLGVGVDRTASLFPSSPIGNLDNRNGVDADGQTITGGNVYSMFADVVDNSEGLTIGFGFSGTEMDNLSLNYKHPQNPFIDSTAYTELTTGAASADGGTSKRFVGFPDLIPPDIHNPTSTEASVVADGNLARLPNNNFGSETASDRQQTSQTSSLGHFSPDGPGNLTNSESADTLGKYFANIGSDDGV